MTNPGQDSGHPAPTEQPANGWTYPAFAPLPASTFEPPAAEARIPVAPAAAPAAPGYAPPGYAVPPYGGYPVSAPPGYGMPMEYPVSAPPTSALPYGYAPAPALVAPPRRGRLAVIVPWVLTALLVVSSGALTTLFVLKSGEANDLSRAVQRHESTISTQRTEIDSLKSDLDSTKRDLADARDTSTELTDQKAALATCLNLIYDMWELMDARKTAEARKKSAEAETACTAADKYL